MTTRIWTRKHGDTGRIKRRGSHAFALFVAMMLGATGIQSKELYVDGANGDDSVSYAQNSASSPWSTLGRAMWGSTNINSPNAGQAAQAGDTVIVRAGVYATTQGTGERYEPIYNPVNDGRPGDPITIRAEGVVSLQSNTSTIGEPIIGTLNRQYIVWDGFYIDEINVDTKADTGPVVVWGSSNITIQNLTVRGKTVNWGDNHSAIRIEYSTDSLIRSNHLFENRGASNQYNGSAIILYDSSGIVMEHNEIHDSQGGIFIKGAYGGTANHRITVRYNLLYNLGVGITHGIVNDAGTAFGARTYQNIVHNSGSGIVFIGYNGSSPANIDVTNNTLYANNLGIHVKPGTSGYRDVVIRNNIILDSSYGIQGEDVTDVSNITFSNNIYSSVGTLARIAYANHSLSSWQSNFNQDLVGSMQSDPMLVNAAGGNFRLSGASPALNAGLDILNMFGGGAINLGAYVTGDEVIGVTSELVDPPKIPMPPTLQ
ncbi:right-handed parallel beta-helix repeat-containing protein [Woeseia oceani]|nr:hypothetical protein [Woeseia oceani]